MDDCKPLPWCPCRRNRWARPPPSRTSTSPPVTQNQNWEGSGETSELVYHMHGKRQNTLVLPCAAVRFGTGDTDIALWIPSPTASSPPVLSALPPQPTQPVPIARSRPPRARLAPPDPGGGGTQLLSTQRFGFDFTVHFHSEGSLCMRPLPRIPKARLANGAPAPGTCARSDIDVARPPGRRRRSPAVQRRRSHGASAARSPMPLRSHRWPRSTSRSPAPSNAADIAALVLRELEPPTHSPDDVARRQSGAPAAAPRAPWCEQQNPNIPHTTPLDGRAPSAAAAALRPTPGGGSAWPALP